jgi:hypothetical protein
MKVQVWKNIYYMDTWMSMYKKKKYDEHMKAHVLKKEKKKDSHV